MSDELIRLEDVSVSFKGRNKEENKVLQGIDMSVFRGEIVGLAGESGSGKSTIAKAILGMVPVKSGQIIRNTPDPQMVFQDPYGALNPAKTVGWIMEEPLKMAGRRKNSNNTNAGGEDGKAPSVTAAEYSKAYTAEERRECVRDMLKEVGLEETYMMRRPDELSGGQRQRVCIGAALMTSPELLIADEPVSALDVTVQTQVLSLMRSLHEKRALTILFISHDLRTMYHFCDRILILHHGKIVEEGKPEQLYRDPQDEYTKLLLKSAGLN